MTLSQLVLRSMKKNIKHYYLYFFALIFSVTLYFSFITLQHNPTVLQATEESERAPAGFGAATYLLYFIVLFFVLYANHLFMKRRSKEIGLYQLIGMTKSLIVRLIALENIILFVCAVLIGMGVGFVSSRLFAMILLKVLEQDVVVSMSFSIEALQSTALVFGILLVIILIQTAFLIHRTSLLSLFNAAKQADERVKRFSWIQMIIGAFGLVLIIYGYYKSSILFTMDDNTQDLFINMVIILATTIGGTFLVFRFSVAFLMNIIRLGKKGYLNLYDVVAVTPIMHRMKGDAKSLTLITVLTAVSLAITTLSYISYYSTGTQARIVSPTDLVVYDEKGEAFLAALDEKQIPYEMHAFDIRELSFNFKDLIALDSTGSPFATREGFVTVLKLSEVQQMYPEYRLSRNEAIIMNYVGTLAKLLPIEVGITASFWTENQTYEFKIKDVEKEIIVGGALSGVESPILIVADEVFKELPMQSSIPLKRQYLVELDEAYVEVATNLYDEMGLSEIVVNIVGDNGGSGRFEFSQKTYEQARLNLILAVGTDIFTAAFLGFTFLLATGSILYFKQMSEADQERASYTILRKVGFSEGDLLKGIYVKQLFNFGVPLLIGLLHSYFAVKSGWFLFGSELLAPLIITMSLYILMYAIFATLSIQYYRRVIKQAL